ncbi:hypothetical protein GW17_00040103 [Ensete ventricosum]|nr:hypothetical protein GW17_00040103 [Ensete ventricosum]
MEARPNTSVGVTHLTGSLPSLLPPSPNPVPALPARPQPLAHALANRSSDRVPFPLEGPDTARLAAAAAVWFRANSACCTRLLWYLIDRADYDAVECGICRNSIELRRLGGGENMSKVVYEGWMVRFGRRKIGRSFIHMRYFVLETRMLAYYKRKPQDTMMVYALCVYNKKEKYHQITVCDDLLKFFQYGSLVEEVDGHTAILYHRLQLDWFPAEQDEREVGYSPRGEEAPSGAPTGKKGHRERLTMAETRLDVLEASVEELYQGQGRLLGVESSQEEAETQIKNVKSLIDQLTETPKIPYDIYMKLWRNSRLR